MRVEPWTGCWDLQNTVPVWAPHRFCFLRWRKLELKHDQWPAAVGADPAAGWQPTQRQVPTCWNSARNRRVSKRGAWKWQKPLAWGDFSKDVRNLSLDICGRTVSGDSLFSVSHYTENIVANSHVEADNISLCETNTPSTPRQFSFFSAFRRSLHAATLQWNAANESQLFTRNALIISHLAFCLHTCSHFGIICQICLEFRPSRSVLISADCLLPFLFFGILGTNVRDVGESFKGIKTYFYIIDLSKTK